jgi:shikimate dehydrogenase
MTDGSEPRRCAVLGSPIGHSLSPVLHRAAYAELGLAWSYEALDVTESRLPEFLAGLDGSWRGLSLTMPLKRAVLPLLDELTERAAQARAANTVLLGDGRLVGDNTDIPGAVAALRERWDGVPHSATVLGGGATAASVLLSLADLGCTRATLLVRSPDRAGDTVAAVARHPRPPHLEVAQLGTVPDAAGDVVVSTIPVDAQDEAVLQLARSAQVVFDVVYDPWPTPLADSVTSQQVLVTGLDLLVHQAALQVELMTGVPSAPLAAMRAAGESALGVGS